jgi:hypothetical protein
MTEFSTTATEILYLNLRIVERKDPQITKRNWLLNLDFLRIAWVCALKPSSSGGTVRPSAFAVLRLMAKTNLVGWKMGMSAGFAPFRI